MAEAADYIGRCRVLRDACVGLMSRLDHLNNTLLSATASSRPVCLKSADYGKLRKKLDSAFPEAPESLRTPAFEQQALSTCEELSEVATMFADVVELRDAVMATLRDVSGARTGMQTNVRLDQNGLFMANVMGLFVALVQLHLVVGGVDERKSALSMYFAAHLYTHRRPDPAAGRIGALMAVCDDPLRRLYDEFDVRDMAQLRQLVSDALKEIRESLDVSFHANALRHKGVLNPLHEGAAMALPTQQLLTTRLKTVLLATELLYAEQYAVWVVYSGLILPQVVFCLPELIELFRVVSGDCLVAPVFRSTVLNVHIETDRLAGWFPPKGVSLGLPKGTKLKAFMKDLSKDATLTAGLKHRERRAYLCGELANLRSLLAQMPGLLGPQFPAVLATVALARAEVGSYYRHYGQSTVKNRQKYYDERHFADPHISILVGNINELTAAVLKYQALVQRYYAEYLRGAHLHALMPLVMAATSNPMVQQKLGTALCERLAGLPGHLARLDAAQPLGPPAGGGGCGGTASGLKEFRWDVARLIGVCSDRSLNLFHLPEVADLMRRLENIYLHTKFVDQVPGLIRRYGELSEGWCFYDVMFSDFENCLQAEDASSKFATTYLKVLGSAVNNLHPHCPEEQASIGWGSADKAEQLAQAIADRVRRQVELLAKEAVRLQYGTTPLAAAHRYERQHEATVQAKRQAGPAAAAALAAAANEPLPGHESHSTTQGSIQALRKAERNLVNLLSSVSSTSAVVFDRLVVPKEYVREQLAVFFRDFCYQVTWFPDHMLVDRPSVALDKIMTACGVLQNVMSHTDMDASAIVRRVLLEECTDWARIYARPKAAAADGGKPNLLDRIANWYKRLLEKVSPGGSARGVVFVPARDGFASSPYTPKGSESADLYMDRAELKALCALLGSGGARAVERAALDFVATHVREIQGIVHANDAALQRFRADYASRDRWEEALAAVMGGGRLDALVTHSIAVGNALMLRRLLRRALGDVCQSSTPWLHDAMSIAVRHADEAEAVGGGGERVAADLEGFKSLAEDFGLTLASGDYSLAVVLAGPLADDKLRELLPHAFAAAFAAESWKKAEYVSRLDGFAGNEHMTIVAILDLFGCFYREPGAVSSALREYLRASSFTVLRMKMFRCQLRFKDYRFNGMTTFLDKLVEQCPLLDRSVIEGFIPYSL
ncbi:unnamed protein product, partial [Phaeothamnion confervicola]